MRNKLFAPSAVRLGKASELYRVETWLTGVPYAATIHTDVSSQNQRNNVPMDMVEIRDIPIQVVLPSGVGARASMLVK